MGRDRGRGKGGGRGSGGRGGGKKMYIANIEELEKREREVGGRRPGEEEDEDEEEEVEGKEGVSRAEDQAEGGKGPVDETVFAFGRKTRAELAAERSAAAAAAGGGVASDEEDNVGGLMSNLNISNPNRVKMPAEKMIKVKNVNEAEGAAPEAGMNRKEREALAAARAKEEYQRRHMAGETDQAKRELAQLAIVRARREEAAKKREVEGRAPGWTTNGVDSSSDSSDDEEEGAAEAPKVEAAPKGLPPSIAKKKAAVEAEAEETAADGGPPKLKAMDIKKLNGDALKEHLKLRNLDTQGQKKDLIKRLTDYEAARP